MKLKVKITLVTSIILTLLLSNMQFAQENNQYLEEANMLKKLNVFQGSDAGFELERAPTRLEGGVMFVRLLGAEQEAVENNYSHPFTDVPDWGSPYVGYMYKMGLTQGISDTQFGSDDNMIAKSYATFLLRALGYDDSQGDFSWSTALEYSQEVKLIDESFNSSLDNTTFLRDHVAKFSLNVLSTNLKNNTDTLSDKLISQSVFSVSTANDMGLKIKNQASDTTVSKSASMPEYTDIQGIPNYIVLNGVTYYRPMVSSELKEESFDVAYEQYLYDFELTSIKDLNKEIDWDAWIKLKWTQFDWNDNSHGENLKYGDYWYENDGGNSSTALSYVESQNLRLPTEVELKAFLDSFNHGIIEDLGWPRGRYWSSDLASDNPAIHRYVDSNDLIGGSNNDAYNNYVILVSDAMPSGAKETVPNEVLHKGIVASTEKLYGMNDISGVANSISVDGTLIYRPYTTNEVEKLIGEKMYDYSLPGKYGYVLDASDETYVTLDAQLATWKKANPNIDWDMWKELEWPIFDRIYESNDYGFEEEYKGNTEVTIYTVLQDVEQLEGYDLTPKYLLDRLYEAYPEGKIETTFGWPVNNSYFTSSKGDFGFSYSVNLMHESPHLQREYKFLNYGSITKSVDIKKFRLNESSIEN